jgi:hypothetical protein
MKNLGQIERRFRCENLSEIQKKNLNVLIEYEKYLRNCFEGKNIKEIAKLLMIYSINIPDSKESFFYPARYVLNQMLSLKHFSNSYNFIVSDFIQFVFSNEFQKTLTKESKVKLNLEFIDLSLFIVQRVINCYRVKMLDRIKQNQDLTFDDFKKNINLNDDTKLSDGLVLNTVYKTLFSLCGNLFSLYKLVCSHDKETNLNLTQVERKFANVLSNNALKTKLILLSIDSEKNIPNPPFS